MFLVNRALGQKNKMYITSPNTILSDPLLPPDTSKKAVSITGAHIRSISRSFYADQMGFFCKKEWKLEKATGLPVRFRLGSLAYVDRMEGK